MKNDEENKNARLRLVRLYKQAADATKKCQHHGLAPFARDPRAALVGVRLEAYEEVVLLFKGYVRILNTLCGFSRNYPGAEIAKEALRRRTNDLVTLGVGGLR